MLYFFIEKKRPLLCRVLTIKKYSSHTKNQVWSTDYVRKELQKWIIKVKHIQSGLVSISSFLHQNIEE